MTSHNFDMFPCYGAIGMCWWFAFEQGKQGMPRTRLGYSVKASSENFGEIKRVITFRRRRASTARQTASKVGGTIGAPCGSGKKCKKRCGVTLN